MKSRTLASAAIFTAFVAAATSVFTITIPATTGYFNVGEIMVYTSALLMGPYVGAFAGGVGSMIADLLVPAPYFAPGTLVIKGIEGFIVGYLGTRTFPKVTRAGWRGITLGFGLVFCMSLAYVGYEFLSGDFAITLGGAWNIPAYTFDLQVPQIFWPVLGTIGFVVIALAATRIEVKSGQSIMSVLVGGSEMVAGYYLYESLVLTLIAPASVVATLAPAAEVPFNVAQALIGFLVAVPLSRSIKRITRGRGLWSATTDVSSGSPEQ